MEQASRGNGRGSGGHGRAIEGIENKNKVTEGSFNFQGHIRECYWFEGLVVNFLYTVCYINPTSTFDSMPYRY
jgi:hypothetical protein